MMWKSVLSRSLLVLILAGCGGTQPELTPGPPATPQATEMTGPRVTARTLSQAGRLNLLSPLESTQASGGADIRIAFHLVDHDNLPVEGAQVQAELWAPDGELFADLPCRDNGAGRYLAELVRLPMRGAGGTWQVVGKAIWDGNKQAETGGSFQADPSISEIYQNKHSFWIEYPRIFASGKGFYNLSAAGGLHFEDWLDQDGSGTVILDNYRYNAIGVTFATLEVHWRQADFPPDTASAIAYASRLADRGLHHQDPDAPITSLSAKKVPFQGRQAWQVLGRGQEAYVSRAAAGYPVEWLIFPCTGSDWLWALVIAADREVYMDPLRELLQTFECPAAG